MHELTLLVLGLVTILSGAALFTNAIEWFGKKLKLSEGMIGSVLAAVGTALPETIVPIVAIVFGNGDLASREGVGIGAIIGAPFMLSTLALFVTGVSAVMFRGRRRTGATLAVDRDVLRRDLGFFLLAYPVALLASLIPPGPLRLPVVIALVAGYALYVLKTLRSGDAIEDHEIGALFFSGPFAGRGRAAVGVVTEPAMWRILAQLLVSLGAIVGGAHYFVDGLVESSHALGIPPLLLSLIITPVATELPEKFNSVIWMRQGKDTLALGNITGAMAFQSSLIPAIGIMLTSWHLNQMIVASAVIALVSAGLLYTIARDAKQVKAGALIFGGALYGVYIAYLAAFQL